MRTGVAESERSGVVVDRAVFSSRPISRDVVATGNIQGQWTELLSGSVHPGDTLVTNAMISTGHRL